MEGASLLHDFAVILVIAGLAGWLFRKLQLSAVVGYLLAGVIVGPYTPPFALVSDLDRIQTLSELGLVFLMFYVGLNLSLAKIQRMGFSVVAATVVTALIVFQLAQVFALAAGWDATTALIFAAMLMVSSSAIITKLLAESGLTHERFAQNAMGVTVLEDVVAVVMLTLIGSQLQTADADSSLGETLVMLLGFVVLLLVAGLLVMPRLLRRFGKSSDADLSSILLAGLAFGAGYVAMEAGFSVALGAFLFGVVVAGTSFKSRIEKRLGGAQDMFSAIFFVSIGMLIDTQEFVANLPLILLVSAFALIARTLAATLGFLATGNTLRLAAMSGLVVTPIGEFSYIIAQTGVSAGAVPESFYAVAVGTSIVTAVLAPLLARSASSIGAWLEIRQPAALNRAIERYQQWLEAAGAAAARNHVWRLTRRRVAMACLELLLLAGLLGFAPRVYESFQRTLVRLGYDAPGWEIGYWVVVGFVALVLLVSLWRSLSALSMIYAEVLASKAEHRAFFRPALQAAFQTLGVLGLALLVWLLHPVRSVLPWFAAIVPAVLIVLALVMGRRMIRWHGVFEASLAHAVDSAGGSRMGRFTKDAEPWNVQVAEVILPEQAACSGRTIRELALRSQHGCSIVEIERQGVVVANPAADFALFPGDRLLLFGADGPLRRARELFSVETDTAGGESDFGETVLADVPVGVDSPRSGRSLADLQIPRLTGVQVMGVERNGARVLNPGGEAVFQAGDQLLVMGTAREIRQFRAWLDGADLPANPD